jgi:hypothetical protein
VVSTVIGVHGAVAHNLGALAALLGEHDTAEAHLAHALEIHEALRAPFFVALTELEWGRLRLTRRGRADKERARRLFEAADLLAARHGYPGVARAAAAQRTKAR